MADQTERLKLIVDAATSDAESGFRRLTAEAKGTDAAATRTAGSVAAAADVLAQARLRESDAAGKLSVAEVRLQELRDTGRAKASQVAAAEERVESARRQLQVATAGVARATEDNARAQTAATTATTNAATETERFGRASGIARDQVRGLVTVAGSLAGFALADYLRDASDAFVTGARTAGQLATSMNATVEQGGRLGVLAETIGLDFDDLIEIQAEFAQKVAANGTELSNLGVTISRNADGTINWANTLTDTLEVLQDIPDATERNRIGFQYFGEEGYKQLSRLVNSGMSVSDALDQIGTPFSAEDVQAAADYDQALREASLAGADLERTIGRALLPLVTNLAGGLGGVVDVVTGIPLPLALTTAAAVALGITGFDPAAAAGGRLAAVIATVRVEAGLASANMVAGGAAAGVLGAGLGGAAALGSGLLSLLGGPLGVGLITAGGLFYLAKGGADAFEDSVAEAAQQVQQFGDVSAAETSASIRQLAEDLAAGAGFWERYKAASEGVQADDQGGFLGFFTDAGTAIGNVEALGEATTGGIKVIEGYEGAIRAAAEELGPFAAQQGEAQIATKGLSDLIAEGTTTGADFAVAVQAAADAQNTQAGTSGLAEAAIAAYNSVTRDAVDSTLGLINAQLSRNDSEYAFLDAMDRANAAVDDTATSVDEVAQANNRLQQSALATADAAADAAVAAATANGTVLTDLAESQIRADATISDLQARLNTPGLGDGAKAAIQGIIDQLVTAKDNGTIEATLQTLGLGEATAEIDTATEDRDTNVTVESRGGPAVIAYLNSIAAGTYLALVRVESRNGPAVLDYLRAIAAADRLALIQTESRGGPAVIGYLNSIAGQYRLAIINVESRGGPAVDAYLNSLARTRTATINVRQQAVGAPVSAGDGPTGVPLGAGRAAPQMSGAGGGTSVQVASVSLDLELTGSVDRNRLSAAERGRAVIHDIQAAERTGGARWRRQ